MPRIGLIKCLLKFRGRNGREGRDGGVRVPPPPVFLPSGWILRDSAGEWRVFGGREENKWMPPGRPCPSLFEALGLVTLKGRGDSSQSGAGVWRVGVYLLTAKAPGAQAPAPRNNPSERGSWGGHSNHFNEPRWPEFSFFCLERSEQCFQKLAPKSSMWASLWAEGVVRIC